MKSRIFAEVTKAYVRVCHEYQVLKFDKSKKYGWLNPVPIPQAKWQHISLDWIEHLPRSQGKNSIMTVIDRATCQVHLVATTITSTGEQTPLQLLDSVFKYHGLATSISSD